MNQSLSVLLIDDSADENLLNAMRLRKMGMTVVAALNSDEAMAALQTFAPDILVVDYSLRETTGPLLMAQILASIDIDPYCVIATGHVLEDVEVGSDLLDRIHVVQKPLTHQKLVQLIDEAVLSKRNRKSPSSKNSVLGSGLRTVDHALGRTEQ